MISLQRALSLFSLAFQILALTAATAIVIAILLVIWAIVCKNKDRRRQLLRRAGMCFLAALLLFGSDCSVPLLVPLGGHSSTFVAAALLALVVAFMVIGFSISIFGIGYSILARTQRPRRPLAIRSLIGLLLFGMGLVPPSLGVLVWYAAKPDYVNHPGTLTQLGKPAPEFTISDTDGTPFRSSDCRGKVVLLNFFATWCGPCQMELPHLQAIWKEFEDDSEFRMLVIGREESDETIKAFKTERSFTFPMASDPRGLIFGEFASQYIPRTYLISRDGTIVFQTTGFYEEEIAKLKALLHKELARKG
ncbi:MAG: TlpA family protein disulfide reductase [Thermoguttaceae bacterium]